MIKNIKDIINLINGGLYKLNFLKITSLLIALTPPIFAAPAGPAEGYVHDEAGPTVSHAIIPITAAEQNVAETEEERAERKAHNKKWGIEALSQVLHVMSSHKIPLLRICPCHDDLCDFTHARISYRPITIEEIYIITATCKGLYDARLYLLNTFQRLNAETILRSSWLGSLQAHGDPIRNVPVHSQGRVSFGFMMAALKNLRVIDINMSNFDNAEEISKAIISNVALKNVRIYTSRGLQGAAQIESFGGFLAQLGKHEALFDFPNLTLSHMTLPSLATLGRGLTKVPNSSFGLSMINFLAEDGTEITQPQNPDLFQKGVKVLGLDPSS